tara:strand:+ start:1655 stop:2539 length:885 start_codon:yes stop_codon:yes gene_type:complete
MEFFTVLQNSEIHTRSFEENCNLIGKDYENFNFTDCIKTISSDFENHTKYFISNIKIQKKYIFISLIVALILILIAVKTQNKYLYPMKIVALLFLQIGIAIGRKFLWSFLFKASVKTNLTPIDSIMKLLLQRIIRYYSGVSLRDYLFPEHFNKRLESLHTIFPNIDPSYIQVIDTIFMGVIGYCILHLLYIKPLREKWNFNYLLQHYAGLSFLVGTIIIESFLSEIVLVWGLGIQNGWIKFGFDFLLDKLTDYIIMPFLFQANTNIEEKEDQIKTETEEKSQKKVDKLTKHIKI